LLSKHSTASAIPSANVCDFLWMVLNARSYVPTASASWVLGLQMCTTTLA
jgi:hypothetical protein